MVTQGDPGRPEGHAHLIQSWLRLADQLGFLIGDNGFCALFGRACRMVSPEFRWLADMPQCKTRATQIEALDGMLASVAPEHAQAAHAALLLKLSELLAALIGQALTRRLLDAAALDEDEQKNPQEHK